MPSPIILLDMDELLADFVGGACRIHGVTAAQMDAYREVGEWSITGPLGRAIGRQLSMDEFWQPINDGSPAFWELLDELPTFAPLLELVEPHDWYIVSAPSRAVGSHTGKVNWLKRRLGDDFDRFLLTPHKQLLAGRGRILIDDRAANCERFIAAGGQAILFPTLGGPLYEFASDPVPYVRSQLEQMLCK